MLYDYISQCDMLFPNTVEVFVKEKWLDRLEEKLRLELSEVFDAPKSDTVAVYPYDGIYVEYLKMKCAEAVQDVARYNNFLAAYNAAHDELYAYYAREFKRKKEAKWQNVL